MANYEQYKAIVIGGSAGSFPVLMKMLSNLDKDFNLPIIIALHRLKHIREGLVEALSIKSVLRTIEPLDKQKIEPGVVYLAPANYHMYVELGNTLALSTEEMVNYSRPAIDLTLETAGYVFKNKLIGILLSGANRDGAHGMKKINEYGGLTIVQDPEECKIDTMPRAAMAATQIDHIYETDRIIAFLNMINRKKRTHLSSIRS